MTLTQDEIEDLIGRVQRLGAKVHVRHIKGLIDGVCIEGEWMRLERARKWMLAFLKGKVRVSLS